MKVKVEQMVEREAEVLWMACNAPGAPVRPFDYPTETIYMGPGDTFLIVRLRQIKP